MNQFTKLFLPFLYLKAVVTLLARIRVFNKKDAQKNKFTTRRVKQEEFTIETLSTTITQVIIQTSIFHAE